MTTMVSASTTVDSRCATGHGAAFGGGADGLVDGVLGAPVDLGGGLVEQQDVSLARQGAG
jgi:hypothetical protein